MGLGSAGLTDGELLALVLGGGSGGGASGPLLEISRGLLARFGGLRGLARSHPRELTEVPGIGAVRACAVAAVVELARRIEAGAQLRGEAVSSSADAYRLVRPHLALMDQEIFVVLALDARHRALALHRVAQGSATSVEVHPREVFLPAVREGAAAVVVAHNHPSGDPEPSPQDHQLTHRLKQASEIMCIPLLDHLVVGAGAYVSLADRGGV